MRSHFRLDPTARPEGCLSLNISGPQVPGIWPSPDDSQFIVTRKARCFLVAHYPTHTPEEVNTISSREHEAAELTGQAPDQRVSARRSRRKVTSLAMKTSRMTLRIIRQEVSWIYAYPLASKKAAEVPVAIETVVDC